MRAERLLPQENKIKFVVNGKVFYYTKEELREYFEDLYRKNNCPFGGIDGILAKLEKYDGDMYGNVYPEARKTFHEMLDVGLLPVLPSSFKAQSA